MILMSQNFYMEAVERVIKIHWATSERVIKMLERNGIAREISEPVFGDPRLEIMSGLFTGKSKPFSYFSKEFGMFNEKSYQRGIKFIKENTQKLDETEKQYGIPPEFIAALARMETNFGDNYGKHPAINYLYTWLVDRRSPLKRRNFAKWEIISLFRIVEKNKWDIFNILGSYMGCFGLLQFTPTSCLRLAVDGNCDGVIDLFNWDDAIMSAANHLKINGFGKSLASRRRALYRYNNSWAYVRAIMEYAKKIKLPQ